MDSIAGLRRELDETRARLAEAQEALDAIRQGEVDGLVLAGPAGAQVFTLQGAQEPYRLLIEQMSEGALTLSRKGVILYANRAVADLLQLPLERVIGAELQDFVSPPDQPALASLIQTAWAGSSHGEVSVRAAGGATLPLGVSLNRLQLASETLVCVVVSDLTAQRSKEDELRRVHAGLEQRVTERTADLALSRLAALNMTEEALEARKSTEAANQSLRQEMDERHRIAQELSLSHTQLEQLLDHSPAILYRLNVTGGTAVPVAISRNVHRLLGFTPQEVLDADWFWHQLHPDDRLRAETSIPQTLERGEGRIEYRLRTKAGDYRWLADHSQLLRDTTGQPAEIAGVMLDITERKQSEAMLEKANAEMVKLSRSAGMAEVATSVLHNVGNVLNSVSVSAEVAAGKVRQSRADGLKAVAALLREHAQDLPAFLARDPRGRELPDYLLKLADHLAEVPGEVLHELDALRKNIGHIKGIVALQQQHARSPGVWETLPVTELVEDAVRINAAGFARHAIRLTREFSPVPPLRTDRHKVLQILVNLLNNAENALSPVAGDKRLTVRVALAGKERVRIEVADNGTGIAPENLGRIFQHGFTTRRDGHGFGLHSGALAAQQLGGTLTARSDGPGCGATFTLDLPVHPTGESS